LFKIVNKNLIKIEVRLKNRLSVGMSSLCLTCDWS